MKGWIVLFLGMALLVFLVYKGMSNIYAALLCALAVALCNAMPLLDTLKNVYVKGIADWMPVGFAFAVMGACLGHIYTVSHGAEAVGRKLFTLWGPTEKMSRNRRVLVSLVTMSVMQAILTFTGVSGTVVLLTSVPIAKAFGRAADIPDRYLPAMMMSPGASAAMAAPCAPTIGNITASALLETSAAAGLLGGFCGFFAVFAAGNVYLYRLISKDPERREDNKDMEEEKTVYPEFWQAFIPLAVIFVTYSLLRWDIMVSLTAGILLALALMRQAIPGRGGRKYTETLNLGFRNGTHVFFQIASLMGFAAVVQKTAAFGEVAAAVTSLAWNPYMIVFITIVIFTLLTSSPPAALALGLPALLPYIRSGQISAGAMHRIAVMGTTTFESMPYSGAAIIAMQLSGVRFKEGYPPVFVCTVAIPLAAAFLLSCFYMAYGSCGLQI